MSPLEILVYVCAIPPQEAQAMLSDTRYLRGIRAFIMAAIEIRVEAERKAANKAGVKEE